MLGRIRVGLSEGFRLAAHSLSGRLLLLTLFYVMVGEVLIFVPTIGQYYRELLGNHTESAELAILPFTLPGGNQLPDTMRVAILERAGAQAVLLTLSEQRYFFDLGKPAGAVDVTIDLTRAGAGTDMVEALSCLFHRGDRLLHVIAPTRIRGARSIGIILGERPIRDALAAYAWRVVITGLFVSAVAASLLFLSLFFVFVRPMERVTAAMVRFRDDPEDSARIMSASARRDEIGLAERELAAMQRDLFASLQQKTRLAALGEAVARIQHDLRNILANAKLALRPPVGDRGSGGQAPDPAPRRLARPRGGAGDADPALRPRRRASARAPPHRAQGADRGRGRSGAGDRDRPPSHSTAASMRRSRSTPIPNISSASRSTCCATRSRRWRAATARASRSWPSAMAASSASPSPITGRAFLPRCAPSCSSPSPRRRARAARGSASPSPATSRACMAGTSP